MRIKEFAVSHYGPLSDNRKVNTGDFTLFFGNNEEGKTLTIDALIKMLLKQESLNFERINRVAEQPEGYVIVERGAGEEIQFPEEGDLSEVIGLTGSECRNIFIIRDSDLSISRESDFYKDVTDKLVGLRTEEISELISKIGIIGNLNTKGSVKDTPSGKIKKRIDTAMLLVKKTTDIAVSLSEINFDGFEEKLFLTEAELEKTEAKIEAAEEARNRDKYLGGKDSLEALEKALTVLKDSYQFNREEEKTWQQNEAGLEEYETEKKRNLENVSVESKKIAQAKKQLEKERPLLKGMTREKNKIEEVLKPEIIRYKAKENQIWERKNRGMLFFNYLAVMATLLFILSSVSIFAMPQYNSFNLPAIVAAFLVLSLFLFYRLSLKIAEVSLGESLKKLKDTAGKMKLKAESSEKILKKINDFYLAYDEKIRAINELEKDIAVSSEKNDIFKKSLAELEEKIKTAGSTILAIKKRSGVTDLAEYSALLGLKEENEQVVNTRKSVLESHFGKHIDISEPGDIAHWKEKVVSLSEYDGKAEGVSYDEDHIRLLKNTRDGKKRRKAELENKMSALKKEIELLGHQINSCLSPEYDYMPFQTLKDLQVAKVRLEDFIQFHKNNIENAREAIRILEILNEEEDKKIRDLFGEKSAVSNYFSMITGELYREVLLNREKDIIEVMRSDGSILEGWKLSGGGYDQLYFSIRLSLGERLLKGEKGFFILDDPFLKSDSGRLKNQIELLRKIAAAGWQIIFFTAKDEIKDALEKDIKKGTVDLVLM